MYKKMKKYLDYEKRAGAAELIVTKSHVRYQNSSDHTITVKGGLGAIGTEGASSRYVAFCGVEFEIESSVLSHSFSLWLSPESPFMITISILRNNKTYSYDFLLKEEKLYSFKAEDFVETRRGRSLGKKMDSFTNVNGMRVFLKRSLNQQYETSEFPFSFSLIF